MRLEGYERGARELRDTSSKRINFGFYLLKHTTPFCNLYRDRQPRKEYFSTRFKLIKEKKSGGGGPHRNIYL